MSRFNGTVDKNYIICSGMQNVLLYRAFPRAGVIPKFDDVSNFKGMGLFEKWILNLKEYWETDDIKEISNMLFLETL